MAHVLGPRGGTHAHILSCGEIHAYKCALFNFRRQHMYCTCSMALLHTKMHMCVVQLDRID